MMTSIDQRKENIEKVKKEEELEEEEV